MRGGCMSDTLNTYIDNISVYERSISPQLPKSELSQLFKSIFYLMVKRLIITEKQYDVIEVFINNNDFSNAAHIVNTIAEGDF